MGSTETGPSMTHDEMIDAGLITADDELTEKGETAIAEYEEREACIAWQARTGLACVIVDGEHSHGDACSHCGGPGPIQVGLCEGCDRERESVEAGQLAKRRRP